MSIKNLLTSNLKSDQDLKVNDLEATSMTFSGSNQSPLNDYYETEFQLTFTGPWAGNQLPTIKATRIGRLVTLEFDSMLDAANSTASTIESTTPIIDARLLPLQKVFSVNYAEDNGNEVDEKAIFTITTGGDIVIGNNSAGGNFNVAVGTGVTGTFVATVSYFALNA